MVAHVLDKVRQAPYVVRRLSMHVFDDYSLPKWNVTSTIYGETAGNEYLTITHTLDGMRQARHVMIRR